jgi:hypothetical protein
VVLQLSVARPMLLDVSSEELRPSPTLCHGKYNQIKLILVLYCKFKSLIQKGKWLCSLMTNTFAVVP